jgi:transcriptional regulator with XRE-family HTH domain
MREPTPTPASGQADDTKPRELARRLKHLFETVLKPDGSRYTYREVVAGIQAQGGPDISVGYLSLLVTGGRANPMMDAVQGLAGFFRVPISYFDLTTDAKTIEEDLKVAAAMRDAGVQEIATRSLDLPEGSRQVVLDMINRLRQIEGLPPEPDDT